jgi:hypothetical protein
MRPNLCAYAPMSKPKGSAETPLRRRYPHLTSARVMELAGRGLRCPELLYLDEIEELCGSVMEHIAEHGPVTGHATDDLLGS